MKPTFVLLLLLLAGLPGSAQDEKSPEAAIPGYAAPTAARLRRIADSLNTVQQQREVSRVFAAPQMIVQHVIVRGRSAKAAFADMRPGMSAVEVKAKYPAAIVREQLFVTQGGSPEELGLHGIDFSAPDNDDPRIYLKADHPLAESQVERWLASLSPATKARPQDRAEGWYFPCDFVPAELQGRYARILRALELFVEPNVSLFLPGAPQINAWTERRAADSAPRPAKAALMQFLSPRIGVAHVASRAIEYGQDYYDTLASSPLNLLIADTQYLRLLDAALAECMARRIVDHELETIAAFSGRNAEALQLKRSYIVTRSCGVDPSPQTHIHHIMRLAARAGAWPVFIRARLMLLPTGAHAHDTYVRDLEALHIDVQSLLLAIALRSWGSEAWQFDQAIGMAGRSLAALSQKGALEQRMAGMISDRNLDLYNRLRVYFVYDNYRFHREGRWQAYKNEPLFAEAVETLPAAFLAEIRLAERKRVSEAAARQTEASE